MAALGFAPGGHDPDNLSPRLRRLLDHGFVEIDGCVVFRRFLSSARSTSIERCGDETGFEAFVNHIHVEDLAAAGASPEDVLAQAALFVDGLATKLEHEYPERAFQIIVAVSDSCTVRFHVDRPGEAWLAADLEGYTSDAVLELSIGRR